MVVAQVFFQGDLHAFHLYLHVDQKGENTLMSTVPHCLLNKFFPSTMATIRHAQVPNAFECDKLLQILANKILGKKELHAYFYKEYMLTNGRVSPDIAETIINYQDIMLFYPSSYYTTKTNEIKFFVLNQIYCRKKRHILRTAKHINKDDFDYNYIFNAEMRLEFELLLKQNSMFIEIVEEGKVEYVLMLSDDRELLMFVVV